MTSDSRSTPAPATFAPDAIEREMIRLVAERGDTKTICPSEVARALGGSDEKVWRRGMKPIREVATMLHRQGKVELRRKGRRVEPDVLRGIYRIGKGTGRGRDE